MPDFFEAVESGDVALVSSMLKSGTQVNKRREALLSTWNGAAVSLGPTPLMLAMRRGRDEVAMLLLKNKADPLLVDQFGKTAAMIALEFGHHSMAALKEIVKDMPPNGVNARDEWKQTLVMYAAVVGAADVVDLLLAKGDSPVRRGSIREDDDNLLSLSAKHGQALVVDRLLGSHKRSSSSVVQSSALIVACTSGHWIESLVDVLKNQLDDPDAQGITPLMHALCFGHDHVARKLIECGVDVTFEVPAASGSGAATDDSSRLAESLAGKPMLTIALEKNAELLTIRSLVLAGGLHQDVPRV